MTSEEPKRIIETNLELANENESPPILFTNEQLEFLTEHVISKIPKKPLSEKKIQQLQNARESRQRLARERKEELQRLKQKTKEYEAEAETASTPQYNIF